MKVQYLLLSCLILVSRVAISETEIPTAEAGIVFSNIADNNNSGISFERVRSKSFAKMQKFRNLSLTTPQTFTDLFDMPHQSHGLPGVAIFDFDKDGDLDIYITNGPGASNSLYSSQLNESGLLNFIDVGDAAGVGAKNQDSTGVCYGDIDNDGDHDLFVLGRNQPNVLFINQGDGHFNVTDTDELGGGNLSSVSCAMGDVNGDGLLDITVGNGVDLNTYSACFVEAFSKNQPNQLYINQGGNHFADVSDSSGIRNQAGIPEGSAGYTWSSAMIDINKDGHTDIVYADEQCGIPTTVNGGVDRGYIHVMLNDGTGHFNDKPLIINDQSASAWMGLAFGDLNCDGNFDIVASNAGDYGFPSFGGAYQLGDMTTRWFLGKGNGEFTDPGVGDLTSGVFAWGVGIFDYDNDADPDMIWQGGLDLNYQIWADNPGVILENQGCNAKFTWDKKALSTNYTRRNPKGLALGDLNQDGFVDFVTASNFIIPEHIPLQKSPAVYNSAFDDTSFYLPVFDMPAANQFVWNGIDLDLGTATIEINSADNNNGWVSVSLIGSKGIANKGRVNRDALGAVLSFTVEKGSTVMASVPSGSSFASQHSLETIFGLGSADSGTVDVIWPGGTKNRLYNAKNKEHLIFPEIPCSYDGDWDGAGDYMRCVSYSLFELKREGVIKGRLAKRYLFSAARAYYEHQEGKNKKKKNRRAQGNNWKQGAWL